MSPVWTEGRQSQNFMNINDGPDLCLGLHPQMPTAYFSASLLVQVKIDRCLFSVTNFGIVCFDRLSCYWNDEMTSLDQHVLMNMQNRERTGDKVDRTGDNVAISFDLDKSIDFCRKSLRYSTLSPVCSLPGLTTTASSLLIRGYYRYFDFTVNSTNALCFIVFKPLRNCDGRYGIVLVRVWMCCCSMRWSAAGRSVNASAICG